MGVVQRINVADECVTPCGDVLSLAWRLFYGCAWISHTTNGSVAGHGVVKKEQDSYLETQIIMEEFKKKEHLSVLSFDLFIFVVVGVEAFDPVKTKKHR